MGTREDVMNGYEREDATNECERDDAMSGCGRNLHKICTTRDFAVVLNVSASLSKQTGNLRQ